MKKIMAVLLVMVVLFTAILPKQTASAEALTIAVIAGGAYAIASASGMDFAFTGYDGQSAGQWMQNRINSWLDGRTIAEAFGGEAIRLAAGKLLIPSAAVAGIVSFLGDLKQDLGLTENMQQPVTQSVEVAGAPVNVYQPPSGNGSTWSGDTMPNVTFLTIGSSIVQGEVCAVEGADRKISVYLPNGNITWTYQYPETGTGFAFLALSEIQNGIVKVIVWIGSRDETRPIGYKVSMQNNRRSYVLGQVDRSADVIIPGAYDPPEGLNDLQSWEGTISDAPDTNIEDLLDDIFGKAADGDLVVGGDIVDNPPLDPEVTPVPTAEPGDIIGLDTISGQLEGIDQTLTGVHEGVGEAVGELEGINEGIGSISEALEVPTTEEAPAFKFDLTTLFPFCIPFDIYRFVTMFSASPVAPHVQIPFNIPAVGLQYTFDLDFSSFDGVASVLRSVELIAFCVGLAILTSKVIRW